MAHTQPHGRQIRVIIKVAGTEYRCLVPRSPTKANLQAVRRECDEFRLYLKRTGDWETVERELRGEEVIAPAGTLHEYAQRWLNTLTVEETTANEYRRTYNRVWRHWGYRQIGSIKKSEIVDELMAGGKAIKTQRNYVSVLAGIFALAREDEVITAVPTDRWKFPKKMPKDPEVYTPEQRDRLLHALEQLCRPGSNEVARFKLPPAGDVPYRFHYLAFYSGMRLEELLGLQPVHLARPELKVRQVRSKWGLYDRTKNFKPRDVYLVEHAWPIIEPLRFGKFLFEQVSGEPHKDGNIMRRYLLAAHKIAGIEPIKTRNPWRATYISIALMNEIRDDLVAQQTGHDVLTLRKHYAGFIPKRTDRPDLEAAFGPKSLDSDESTPPG